MWLYKCHCIFMMSIMYVLVGSGPVNAVAFDYSGLYLGIGGGGENGQQVHVKVVKDWSPSAVSFLASIILQHRTDLFVFHDF